MEVPVEAVLRPVAQVGVDAAQRQVHLGQPPRRRHELLPVDGQVVAPAPVGGDELRRLHEHPSRSAARVEHPPVIRLDDLDQEPDDRPGRVELAGVASLGGREPAEEVLVHPAEHVVGAVVDVREADVADEVDQSTQQALVDLGPGVALGQHPLEARVLLLDGFHRLVEKDPDRRLLRHGLELWPAGGRRHPEDVLRPVFVA
jgi:hypothetical protein